MEFHIIDITDTALNIRAQTEKTTFSCKDDWTLTKHTRRWTYSALRYFLNIYLLRNIFKISDITICSVVPGICNIHFHILELSSILVLFLQHSCIPDKLTGGHFVLGTATPQVARYTNSEHVLKKTTTVKYCM